MNPKRLLVVRNWIAVFALLVAARPVSGATFTGINNGSFNVPGQTTNGYVYNNGVQYVPGWTGGASGALDCYVISTTNQFCGYATLVTRASNSPDGGGFIMFDADPTYGSTLSQQVDNLTVGQNYQLNFWEAANHQSGSGFTGHKDLTFTVSLTTVGLQTNTTQSQTPASPNPNGVTSGWKYISLMFTAQTTSEVLTFAANGPVGGPPVLLLDGVSMVIPEPAEYTLVGLGIVLLLIAARFRKRRPVPAPVDR